LADRVMSALGRRLAANRTIPMLDLFRDYPGRLFVAATLLPLVPVALLLLSGTVRNLARPHGRSGGWAASVYWLLGGDRPLKAGGYLTLAAMVGSAVLAIAGLVHYLHDAHDPGMTPALMEARWAERVDWVRIGADRTDQPATALQLGYRIDMLAALMCAMVTVVGSLIFLFSLGYMADEARERVEDHQVAPPDPSQELPPRHDTTPADHPHPLAAGHGFARRGRFGRFFLYMGLFAFSMLNLVIADNLVQVFVSWELVGACSFFLIGFFYERPAASGAANKAFIVNRVGDAGFLVGIVVAWAAFGTLNIQELIGKFEAGQPAELTENLWLVLGLGLFLGCVGKSAQFPLHTWLPDAMEGPTPVSALIHAATMVAAGVYLVGRCFPLFSPDVLLVIAYTGAITLFLAATIATVMTDIKRVLAYSTVSQLGYMMLALGIGGWTAGLFHLLTHAFFKALLFLGAGSVIHGLHHEQDLRRMGGLRRRMPVTAYTMLVGVLAIAGAPLFSGWYSKDAILADALGYGAVHPRHILLTILPFVTAGLTAFYMVRLWLLAFAGEPRDRHAHDHAHESPWVMTVPLLVLAAFSVGVAWGWPVWDAGASYLGGLLHGGEPAAVAAQFHTEHDVAHEYHALAGGIGLMIAAAGAAFAVVFYALRDPARALAAPDTPLTALFRRKWYFDEAYDAAFLRPTVALAFTSAAADKRPTAGVTDEAEAARPIDAGTLDGVLNALGQLAAGVGVWLRSLQTGFVRQYVMVLALTVVVLLGMLAALTR
jgi:proton-translocating NADH-quinone oxidoreductase chain L